MNAQEKSTNAQVTFAHLINKDALWVLGSSAHNFIELNLLPLWYLLRVALVISRPFRATGVIYTYKFYLHSTHSVHRSHL